MRIVILACIKKMFKIDSEIENDRNNILFNIIHFCLRRVKMPLKHKHIYSLWRRFCKWSNVLKVVYRIAKKKPLASYNSKKWFLNHYTEYDAVYVVEPKFVCFFGFFLYFVYLWTPSGKLIDSNKCYFQLNQLNKYYEPIKDVL